MRSSSPPPSGSGLRVRPRRLSHRSSSSSCSRQGRSSLACCPPAALGCVSPAPRALLCQRRPRRWRQPMLAAAAAPPSLASAGMLGALAGWLSSGTGSSTGDGGPGGPCCGWAGTAACCSVLADARLCTVPALCLASPQCPEMWRPCAAWAWPPCRELGVFALETDAARAYDLACLAQQGGPRLPRPLLPRVHAQPHARAMPGHQLRACPWQTTAGACTQRCSLLAPSTDICAPGPHAHTNFPLASYDTEIAAIALRTLGRAPGQPAKAAAAAGGSGLAAALGSAATQVVKQQQQKREVALHPFVADAHSLVAPGVGGSGSLIASSKGSLDPWPSQLQQLQPPPPQLQQQQQQQLGAILAAAEAAAAQQRQPPAVGSSAGTAPAAVPASAADAVVASALRAAIAALLPAAPGAHAKPTPPETPAAAAAAAAPAFTSAEAPASGPPEPPAGTRAAQQDAALAARHAEPQAQQHGSGVSAQNRCCGSNRGMSAVSAAACRLGARSPFPGLDVPGTAAPSSRSLRFLSAMPMPMSCCLPPQAATFHS